MCNDTSAFFSPAFGYLKTCCVGYNSFPIISIENLGTSVSLNLINAILSPLMFQSKALTTENSSSYTQSVIPLIILFICPSEVSCLVSPDIKSLTYKLLLKP